MKNTRLIVIIAAALSLLLIPFLAMKLGVDGVVWTALDFVVMGAMLLVTGLGIEIALRIIRVFWMRAAAVAGVLIAFVMVWGTLVHMGE
ncbi:MAG: hypothetical protein K1X36_05375 [Pyrinomonadaceae bacterium]|nr:hypothetical protein [Pyrinomonadaceae bacterium]